MRSLIYEKDLIKVTYDNFYFSLPENWVEDFKTHIEKAKTTEFYNFSDKKATVLSISGIQSKIRNEIFKDGFSDDGQYRTAKERVLYILNGFAKNTIQWPVEGYYENGLYILGKGCHRLHCSILYGFEKIPFIIRNKSSFVF